MLFGEHANVLYIALDWYSKSLGKKQLLAQCWLTHFHFWLSLFKDWGDMCVSACISVSVCELFEKDRENSEERRGKRRLLTAHNNSCLEMFLVDNHSLNPLMFYWTTIRILTVWVNRLTKKLHWLCKYKESTRIMYSYYVAFQVYCCKIMQQFLSFHVSSIVDSVCSTV